MNTQTSEPGTRATPALSRRAIPPLGVRHEPTARPEFSIRPPSQAGLRLFGMQLGKAPCLSLPFLHVPRFEQEPATNPSKTTVPSSSPWGGPPRDNRLTADVRGEKSVCVQLGWLPSRLRCLGNSSDKTIDAVDGPCAPPFPPALIAEGGMRSPCPYPVFGGDPSKSTGVPRGRVCKSCSKGSLARADDGELEVYCVER